MNGMNDISHSRHASPGARPLTPRWRRWLPWALLALAILGLAREAWQWRQTTTLNAALRQGVPLPAEPASAPAAAASAPASAVAEVPPEPVMGEAASAPASASVAAPPAPPAPPWLKDGQPLAWRYGQALALEQAGRHEEALARYRSLYDDAALGLPARYNAANILLRQGMALHDEGKTGAALPLIELAKEGYRQVLRQHPRTRRARRHHHAQRGPGPAVNRGNALALPVVAGLLLLALLDPGWTGRRPAHDLVAVLDVTQSMDVADMRVGDDPNPVSRLARSRGLLLQALARLPCGSRLGLGIFTEYRSLLLLAPLEVCEHYSELRATLSAIDGRMAWTGNSEVAKGLYSALNAAKALPSQPAVVFFTDGQESPPVDPRFRPEYTGKVGEVQGLVVGVGGDQPLPIPRHDPSGQPMGTWGAGDVLQRSPRAGGRIGTSVDEPMAEGGGDAGGGASAPSMPGAVPGREHLSALRDAYLQLVARETGLRYHRLQDADGLLAALTAPALAHEVQARVSVRWPATLAALLGLLAFYAAPPLRAAWAARPHK